MVKKKPKSAGRKKRKPTLRDLCRAKDAHIKAQAALVRALKKTLAVTRRIGAAQEKIITNLESANEAYVQNLKNTQTGIWDHHNYVRALVEVAPDTEFIQQCLQVNLAPTEIVALANAWKQPQLPQ